jgi:hypothetical protein
MKQVLTPNHDGCAVVGLKGKYFTKVIGFYGRYEFEAKVMHSNSDYGIIGGRVIDLVINYIERNPDYPRAVAKYRDGWHFQPILESDRMTLAYVTSCLEHLPLEASVEVSSETGKPVYYIAGIKTKSKS